MANSYVNVMLMFVILGFVGVATAAPGEAFVRSGGLSFFIGNSRFFFNGFNAYWLMNVATDTNSRGKVSQAFQQASAAGLTVCRTWAFSDGGSFALQRSPGIYDETVFEALDFVLSEANKHGIRLILSFVNNWKNLGGRAQYVQWARNVGACINGDDDFFTHPIVKNYYKNHVKKVVTRVNTISRIAYKDDPTIMAWELMNEPRCNSDLSGRTVTSWVREMASFVKSVDGNHLLEIGLEGFYGDTSPERRTAVNPGGFRFGTDFISSNHIPQIDFATIHAYPIGWLAAKSVAEQNTFMERWMWNHWQDSRSILKKPLVVGEFGVTSKNRGFTLNGRNYFMGKVYSTIYNYASHGATMSGSLVWQVMVDGMDSYRDGYEIILSATPSTAGIMAKHSRDLKGLS